MAFTISYIVQLKDKFSRAARSIQKSMTRLEKRAVSLRNKFSGLASTFKGQFMAVFGAVAIGRTLLNFETAMNKVKAVSGATGMQFDKLREQAKDLGKATQFSASQAAEAQSFLAMAGFSAEKIFAAMPDTLNLAASANIDLAQSADIVSNVMAGYGMEANELEGAVDVLAKAFTSANTDLSQLGQAMKFAGPVAKSAGVSFEEATAVLALFGNAGIQASMAGTSLRGAIVRLVKPTGEISGVIKKLGLRVKDSNGKLLPMLDIVRQLEKSGADTADMMGLFGLRAGPAMSALVSQGSDALEKMIVKLKDSAGTAKRIAETQMEGLPGAFKRLVSGAENAIIALGDAGLTDALVVVAEALRGILLLVGTVAKAFERITAPIRSFMKALKEVGDMFNKHVRPILKMMGIDTEKKKPAGIGMAEAMEFAQRGDVAEQFAAFKAGGGKESELIQKVKENAKLRQDTASLVAKVEGKIEVSSEKGINTKSSFDISGIGPNAMTVPAG